MSTFNSAHLPHLCPPLYLPLHFPHSLPPFIASLYFKLFPTALHYSAVFPHLSAIRYMSMCVCMCVCVCVRISLTTALHLQHAIISTIHHLKTFYGYVPHPCVKTMYTFWAYGRWAWWEWEGHVCHCVGVLPASVVHTRGT